MKQLLMCLLIFLSTPFLNTNAQTADSLIAKAHTAYLQKHFVESAILIEKAISMKDIDDIVYYNASCYFALAGRKVKAWYYLDLAIKNGFVNVSHMQKDSDLVSLWGDKRWNVMIDTLKQVFLPKQTSQALLNDINNIAAHAYQYMIRPTSMGGGGGQYIGYSLHPRLTQNSNGTYKLMQVLVDKIELIGTTVDGKGGISATIDKEGRVCDLKYTGSLQLLIK